LRKFALEGMHLYGRLKDIADGYLHFQDNLKENLDSADATVERIKQNLDQFIIKNNIDAPPEPPYQPVWQPTDPPLSLNLEDTNIGSLIWCTGFHFNFDWVQCPVFDDQGEPIHQRGVTSVPGLYFIGLPWLYTWGSGRFSGVAQDATYLANQIMTKQITASCLLNQTLNRRLINRLIAILRL